MAGLKNSNVLLIQTPSPIFEEILCRIKSVHYHKGVFEISLTIFKHLTGVFESGEFENITS